MGMDLSDDTQNLIQSLSLLPIKRLCCANMANKMEIPRAVWHHSNLGGRTSFLTFDHVIIF